MSQANPSLLQPQTGRLMAGATVRAAVNLAGPLALAAVLFVLNNSGIAAGILHTPPGYQPMYLYRGGDIAVYMTWLNAFQVSNLLPNYHAPWVTETALFNPLMWLMARAARWLRADVVLVYHVTHFLFHLAAAYGLFALVRVCLPGRKQQWLGWLAIFLALPLLALALVPVTVARALGLTALPPLPGFGDFMWWSSDGFLHGIAGSIFVTFGTATVLGAFALLARYLQLERKRDLAGAAIITAVSAFVHPYEVVLIVGAGVVTLLLWRGSARLRAGVIESGVLVAAAGIGVLPLSVQALGHPWLRAAAEVNRWQPPGPISLLFILGLPATLALMLTVVRRERLSPTDLLLRNAFLLTLVGLYVPWMHWSQHLLDGFHYVAALLLVRLLADFRPWLTLRARYPALTGLAILALTLLSATAYVRYYHQVYLDGSSIAPRHGLRSIAPLDEVNTIAWLRTEANGTDLVLAPPQYAGWLATVPMHSFAGHFAYSLTYPEQRALSEAFFAGAMSADDAHRFLDEYRPRYVVVPAESPAHSYIVGAAAAETLGALTVYRFDGQRMQPYPSETVHH